MSYTLGDAARATGMSKAALSRAIKRGSISAEKQLDGSFKIDPAELHRVYPAVTEQLARTTADATELQAQNIELRAKLEAATQRLHDKDGVIDDLRRRLDTEGEERRKLTAILTDQRAKAPDVIAMPSASPPHVSPAPTETEAAAPADTGEQHYPQRVVVKKAMAPKRTPKPEVAWWRKMIGGR
jgi:hypothetical protein